MNTFKHRLLLRVFCVWTFFVWIVLIKNMITIKNQTLAFRSIHIVLAIISIALAAAVWPLAKRIQMPAPEALEKAPKHN